MNCGETDSNFIHTFWSCKKLKKYWDDSYLALYDIFKIRIPQDPLTALLGVERRDNLYLLQILLAATTKEITVNWLKPTVPTCQSWIERVWQLYRMEEITFNLRLQRETFLKRWSPALFIMFWEKRASPPPSRFPTEFVFILKKQMFVFFSVYVFLLCYMYGYVYWGVFLLLCL